MSICGGVTYSISDAPSTGVSMLSSSELQVDATGLITIATGNSLAVGVHTVTLTVKLTAYITITTTQSFTLTITECVVTSAKVVQASN